MAGRFEEIEWARRSDREAQLRLDGGVGRSVELSLPGVFDAAVRVPGEELTQYQMT